MMNSDFVGPKVLYKLLGHDALSTSKIHSKFIFCQKIIISIALTISHLYYYRGKFKNLSNHMKSNS